MLVMAFNIYLIAIGGYVLLTLLPFFVIARFSLFDKDQINLSKPIVNKENMAHDIKGTLSTLIVIAISSLVLSIQFKTGYSSVEFETNSSIFWILLSSTGIILLHDAYFFITHLLMHRIPVLYRFHLYHHKSTSPTPFSVLSFHPVEAGIHFLFFHLIALLPVPVEAFLIFYAWMLICNTIGHLNIDFYPEKVFKSKLTRWWNSPTHHYLHHQYFNCNYSIYYNYWDKWFKTNHKDNMETFFAIKKRYRPQEQIDANYQDKIVHPRQSDQALGENAMIALNIHSRSLRERPLAEFQ